MINLQYGILVVYVVMERFIFMIVMLREEQVRFDIKVGNGFMNWKLKCVLLFYSYCQFLEIYWFYVIFILMFDRKKKIKKKNNLKKKLLFWWL